jgi:hypothetical protein
MFAHVSAKSTMNFEFSSNLNSQGCGRSIRENAGANVWVDAFTALEVAAKAISAICVV